MMKKQREAAVALFDVDGTLIDSSALWAAVPGEYLCEQGVEPAEDIAEIFLRLGYSDTARYIAQHYLPEEDPHGIMDAFCRIAARKYQDGVSEKPFAPQYLETLKRRNVRCFAVTSNMREIVYPALKRLHMADRVDGIISIYDIGISKRVPQFYHRVAEELGTAEERCVVFEDALFAAESAKKANMYVVGVYDQMAAAEWERLQSVADRAILSFEEMLLDDVFESAMPDRRV